MNTLKPEELKKFIKKLPQEVRDLYFSPELGDKIAKIGEKNGLHIDDMGALSDEVGHVMIGFKTANDFQKNIQSRLGIDSEKSNNLVRDINKEIFEQIRESLGKKREEETSGSLKADEEGLDRESLLKEIEDQPKDLPVQAGEAPKDFLKENVEVSPENKPVIAPKKPEVPKNHNILEEKLSKPVVTDEKKEVRGDKPTYKGGVDPYREVID